MVLKTKKEVSRTKKIIAMTQIFSMIIEIFAISFIMGGMIILSSESVDAVPYAPVLTEDVEISFWGRLGNFFTPTFLTNTQRQQAIVNYNRQVYSSGLTDTAKESLYLGTSTTYYDQLAARQTQFNSAVQTLATETAKNNWDVKQDLVDDVAPTGLQFNLNGQTGSYADTNGNIRQTRSIFGIPGTDWMIPDKTIATPSSSSYAELGNSMTRAAEVSVSDLPTVVKKFNTGEEWRVYSPGGNLNPGVLADGKTTYSIRLGDTEVKTDIVYTKNVDTTTGKVTVTPRYAETDEIIPAEQIPDANRQVNSLVKEDEGSLSYAEDAYANLMDNKNAVSQLDYLQGPQKASQKLETEKGYQLAIDEVKKSIVELKAEEKATTATEGTARSAELAGEKDPAIAAVKAKLEADTELANARKEAAAAKQVDDATENTDPNKPNTQAARESTDARVREAERNVKITEVATSQLRTTLETDVYASEIMVSLAQKELSATNKLQNIYGNIEGRDSFDASSLTPAQKELFKTAGLNPTEYDGQTNQDVYDALNENKQRLSQEIDENQEYIRTTKKQISALPVGAGSNTIPPVTATALFGNEKLGTLKVGALSGLVGQDAANLKQYGLSKVEANGDGTFTLTNTADNLRAQFQYNEAGELVMVEGSKQTADTYKTPLGDFTTYHPLLGNALEGVSWGLTILGIANAFASFLPEENQAMLKPAGMALFLGLTAGKVVYGAFGEWGKEGTTWGNKGAGAKWVGGITGALVAYVYFANKYIKYETREQTIEFKCMTWQAPRGGSSCDVCNNDPLRPCSEYRCKSLGQTCKLLNAGTGVEKCIDSAPDDVTSPGIKPLQSVLTNGYAYSDVKPRPPGGSGPAGMKITYNGGCLPSFTPFKFGILTTDNGKNGVELQPAQCKIDFNHTQGFDDMNYYMDENNFYVENHTQSMSLPGTTLNKKENNSLSVKSDEEYTLYIRCRDGNGNENRDEFAVRFCIDPTPDLTAPIIKTTSIDSGSAVLYKIDNVSLQVYTNEPANCKWGRKDASYSNMENNMSCSNNLWEMNAEMLYTCDTTLTAIKDKEKNDFYFRCQDMHNNTQQQSYDFTLYGTQPLTILNVGPSGTIGSSTSTANITLSVRTDNGFKNGEASCYYSPSSNNASFVKMFETGGNTHKQSLDLVGGKYSYYYQCFDAGGNPASNQTSFEVFVDKYAPAIIRAFQVTNKLYLITDEPSTCKYSTASCNFNIDKEGIDMPYANSIEHYSELKNDQSYYIKCTDDFGNQPEPTECSMIIRPYQLTVQ